MGTYQLWYIFRKGLCEAKWKWAQNLCKNSMRENMSIKEHRHSCICCQNTKMLKKRAFHYLKWSEMNHSWHTKTHDYVLSELCYSVTTWVYISLIFTSRWLVNALYDPSSRPQLRHNVSISLIFPFCIFVVLFEFLYFRWLAGSP